MTYLGFVLALTVLALAGLAAFLLPPRNDPPTTVHPRTLDRLRREHDRSQETHSSRPYLKD